MCNTVLYEWDRSLGRELKMQMGLHSTLPALHRVVIYHFRNVLTS